MTGAASEQIDDPAVAGRHVTGPTALGTDPRRFWHLAWTLATTEFKLRFFGSVLGYFWRHVLLLSTLATVSGW